MLDLVIIGAGAAGLSASIYAQRAALEARTLERDGVGGGQLAEAVQVDNYPGFARISGFALTQAMRRHAEALGSVFETAEAVRVARAGADWEVQCADGVRYRARAVIAATGTQRRRLEVPGETAYIGRGVSYCATCDGAFFRGKTVAVVGGGDTAVDDALFLSDLAARVYLVHRRDTLRANRRRQALLRTRQNVTVLWDTVVRDIYGADAVTGCTVQTRGETRALAVDGVFVAIGAVPHTGWLPPEAARDAAGYLAAGEDGATGVPGLFAAGDIRSKRLRQAVTAAADGACCVASVERYLQENRKPPV